ncbi:hypothetical protein HCN44_004685 [Aphidius gifuensis]|uniref:Uncharacterized protein n=1 Tax=Aphidius gifuensis TaxID=684658 RepID=A0A834XZR2_APHGI|nr:hypothetical protein HCN44_004685 [Aphidius gifuensis]
MHFYIDMAFNCAHDKVWLLKSQDELKNVFHNVLDGYQFQTEYSLNNDFFRQINVGFDNATSISYDWLVKQVFWSEHKNGLYSIKRTDETFYKHLYIILPQAQLNIEDVKVCPKQNEVFFLSNDSIWFTPIETNSTATLLFSRKQYSGWIYKFSIDYATDILYWVAGDESNHDTLLIIILAMCFGRLACTELNTVYPENVLLLLSRRNFYTVKDSSEHFKLMGLGYEPAYVEDTEDAEDAEYAENAEYAEYADFSKSYYIDIAFNCERDKVWLLESQDELEDFGLHNALDESNFRDESKLDTVRQINDSRFDKATSISYDWSTKLLYWSEHSDGKYSIRRTDEIFLLNQYIILPQAKSSIRAVQVYPKRNELFFLSDDSIWYTPIEENSSASLLFSREQYSGWIYEFSIDYATNKLYWVAGDESNRDMLHSVDIGTTARPFKEADIEKIEQLEIIKYSPFNLVAFNNILYWIAFEDGNKLYYKNGNEAAVKVCDLSPDSIMTFVAAICPYYVDIKNTARPFKKTDIKKIKTYEVGAHYPFNLVAFNNALYWITYDDGKRRLYSKNGKEPAVLLSSLISDTRLSIVSSSCPW